MLLCVVTCFQEKRRKKGLSHTTGIPELQIIVALNKGILLKNYDITSKVIMIKMKYMEDTLYH